MNFKLFVTAALLSVSALVFVVGANASTIEGTRLMIKNALSGSNTLKFKSLTEISVNSGNFGSDGDPLCTALGGGGASLRVNGGGFNDFTIELPCEGWITTNGSPENVHNTDYVYEDPSGTTCDRIVVKHGHTLTAICKGPQVAYVLDGPQGDIDLTLRLGTLPLLNCATLGPPPTTVTQDGSNGRRYSARGSPDPASCTSP